MAKAAESLVYKQLQGGVEERKRDLLLDPTVVKAWEEHFQQVVHHEALRARRKRAELVIEVWRFPRTPGRRQGNIP